VDAMPDGGKITLRTAARWWEDQGVQNHGAQKASQVWIEVADTGIGMDEETRSRCLEPFFTTKGTRGTGLGLAMVYGVAERHEAKIEIESAVGQGSTFRLVFPIRRPAADAEESNGKSAPRIPALRILCIDDEPLLRQMLKEMLETQGHDVEVADGGESGLAAFQAARRGRPFHVVITDLGMPRVDARQLAAWVKKESPSTPVIMLTGWGTMMKADKDVPAEVDCVLGKPARMTELFQALRQVMGGN